MRATRAAIKDAISKAEDEQDLTESPTTLILGEKISLVGLSLVHLVAVFIDLLVLSLFYDYRNDGDAHMR